MKDIVIPTGVEYIDIISVGNSSIRYSNLGRTGSIHQPVKGGTAKRNGAKVGKERRATYCVVLKNKINPKNV